MNPGVYGPLDSATNLYTGLPINKQRVSIRLLDAGTVSRQFLDGLEMRSGQVPEEFGTR